MCSDIKLNANYLHSHSAFTLHAKHAVRFIKLSSVKGRHYIPWEVNEFKRILLNSEFQVDKKIVI